MKLTTFRQNIILLFSVCLPGSFRKMKVKSAREKTPIKPEIMERYGSFGFGRVYLALLRYTLFFFVLWILSQKGLSTYFEPDID